jgi:4-methyl-5(b-hydroxyethyl)-thiazole monophosphate biosynthesis
MNAIVFFATGFEEVEAVGTVDVLRRGNIDAVTVSVTGKKTVTGLHGIPVLVEELFEEIDYSRFDALVLPGGGPGSIKLNQHKGVRKAIIEHYDRQKLIAAICASPRVFGSLGLLEGRKATCYPGIEPELKGAIIVDAPAITDHNIITGKGPGFVFNFGLEILTYYSDGDAGKVAEEMLL